LEKLISILKIYEKNITLKNLLLLAFISISCISFAQSSISVSRRTPSGKIRCLSTEYEKYLKANNPNRATREEFENWIAPKIEELRRIQSTQKTAATVMTIPVVIHIIHNGDAIGTNENITDAQALSQITVLNQDFRRMVGTPGENSNPVGADLGIEFCMAQRTPTGTATNGIDRVKKTTAQYATMTSVETMKAATQWDPTKYFNIWTVYFSDTSSAEMNGTLGYAQFPSTSTLSDLNANEGAANTDGLVVDYRCFGSSAIAAGPYFTGYEGGRTATHEIGHCFGLIHIWGDAPNSDGSANPPVSDCSGTDYCADTPAAGYEHYDCGTFDSCPSSPGNDMPENYMDYSPDSCMNIFTLNQKDRIVTVMNNSIRRASLKTSNACTSLGTEKYDSLDKVQLYPNPAKNVINISVSQAELPDSFTVYNNLGQAVESRKIGSVNDLSINTSSYSTGIYLIKILKDNSSKTLQFIKE
jgi:hypothetical protein